MRAAIGFYKHFLASWQATAVSIFTTAIAIIFIMSIAAWFFCFFWLGSRYLFILDRYSLFFSRRGFSYYLTLWLWKALLLIIFFIFEHVLNVFHFVIRINIFINDIDFKVDYVLNWANEIIILNTHITFLDKDIDYRDISNVEK